jgi:uncharacterized C2H2 Zn-finger protein
MPKLTIRSQTDTSTRKPAEEALPVPQPRPCPRCRVMLEAERTYVAKGLSGRPTTEHRFRCPACDARFHYSERTGRWRELTEDPV